MLRVEFYKHVGRLKQLSRTGWVQRGIPNPETVAEHSYRAQFIAYDLAKTLGEDPRACAHMMMLHDLAEAIVGDIPPNSGVSKEQKAAQELKAMQKLAKISDNPEFVDVFEEYEAGQTRRAQICRDADLLECLQQVLEYMESNPEKYDTLEAFWPYVESRISTAPGWMMFFELSEKKPPTQQLRFPFAVRGP